MIKLSASQLTAEQWDALHLDDAPTSSIWERRVIEHFVRRLPQGASVLVLGFGDGATARTISKFRLDLHWTGVDFSQAAIEKDLLKEEDDYGLDELFVMDLSAPHWDFRDKQFDAVIAGDILEYLKDPRAALRECIRIASKTVAATFAISPEVAGRPGLWLFEPQDPWKLLAGTDIKLHHLKEGKLLLAFAGVK